MCVMLAETASNQEKLEAMTSIYARRLRSISVGEVHELVLIGTF